MRIKQSGFLTLALAVLLFASCANPRIAYLEEMIPQTVLRICQSGVISVSREYITAQRFMEQNPDIRIEFVDLPTTDVWSYMSDISRYGLKDIDLLFVSSYEVDALTLAQKGYLSPIRSQILCNQVNNMYPIIGEYLISEDGLLGYPVILYSQWMSVDTSLLNQYGFEEPAEDLDSWLDQMLDWWSLASVSTMNASFDGYWSSAIEQKVAIWQMIELLLHDCQNMEIPSLDTPTNQSFVEKICSIPIVEEVHPTTSDKGNRVYNTNEISPLSMDHSDSSDNKTYIWPIRIDKSQDASCECELMYYTINPFSTNQETAEQYLEFISTMNDSILALYSLYPITEPVVQYGVEVISQKAIELYQKMIPQFVIRHHHPLMLAMRQDEVCNLLMDQVLCHEISADQYLQRLEVRLTDLVQVFR